MKISVVIPVYRTADTLARCVESILGQTYSDWEAILVDDGSPDGAPALCDDYQAADPRIRVLHKPNGGLSDARNAGIGMARGEWITFVDSDDYISPDTLRLLADTTLRHPRADIVEYPVVKHLGGRHDQHLKLDDHLYTDASTYWLNTRAYLHAYACNKMFRATLWQGITFPVGRTFEDVWTIPRLLAHATAICTIGGGLYHYTANSQGITSTATASDLRSHLDAQIHATHILGIGITRPEAYGWYINLLNIQIDLFRKDPGTQPILPRNTIPLNAAQTPSERIKLFILNHFGLNTLCRIMTYMPHSH